LSRLFSDIRAAGGEIDFERLKLAWVEKVTERVICLDEGIAGNDPLNSGPTPCRLSVALGGISYPEFPDNCRRWQKRPAERLQSAVVPSSFIPGFRRLRQG
jgi:hypothetical protein